MLVIRADADPARCDIAVGGALDRLRRLVPPRGGLELRRGDHGVFVIALDDAAAASPRDLAERLIALADEAVQAEAIDVVTRVGIGGAEPLAAASRSYRQARDAATVAQRVARFGRIAAWDELGVYRTLARFPDDLDDDALHPGLVELLRDGAHEQLVETLEAYLDRAGDVKATAGGAQPPPGDAVLPAPADRGDHGRAPEGPARTASPSTSASGSPGSRASSVAEAERIAGEAARPVPPSNRQVVPLWQ